MHTRAAPSERLPGPRPLRGRRRATCSRSSRERIELALARGVAREQLIVDPGPDFAKTPAQTIELLARAARLHELGRPLLMAISRKDFIGALTGAAPRERGAGTLAALAHGVERGGAHLPPPRRRRRRRLPARARRAARASDARQGSRAGRGTPLRPSPALRHVSEALHADEPLGCCASRVPAADQRGGTPTAQPPRKKEHMAVLDRSELEASPLADLHAIATSSASTASGACARPT